MDMEVTKPIVTFSRANSLVKHFLFPWLSRCHFIPSNQLGSVCWGNRVWWNFPAGDLGMLVCLNAELVLLHSITPSLGFQPIPSPIASWLTVSRVCIWAIGGKFFLSFFVGYRKIYMFLRTENYKSVK